MQIIKKLSFILIIITVLLSSCEKNDNPKPVLLSANAGQDQTVNVGQTVNLDGSNSKDSNNKPLTYQWNIIRKPANSNASLSSATVAKPVLSTDLEGDYEMELTVSSENGTQKDNVIITVKFVQVVLSHINSKTILEDLTPNPNVADYLVNEDIGINAELIVKPGVIIAFAQDALMSVNEAGILISKGESNRKIQFTGKVNEKGYWRGIIFYSNNTANELTNTEILNAGSKDVISQVKAGITVAEDARITIKNSLISGSKGYGMYFSPGAILKEFATNTISNNEEAPLLMEADLVAKLDAASSFSSGNKRNAIEIFSSFLTSANEVVWQAFNDKTPYRFLGTITVNAGWKLNPGVTIEVAPENYFEIGDGYINAIGTADKRITITGVDRTSNSWKGIVIYSRNNFNVIENADISYAGNDFLFSGAKTSIAVTSAGSLSIRNSRISNSGGTGIHINGDDVMINADVETANTFVSNASVNVLYVH
jgi:hypothetical protein